MRWQGLERWARFTGALRRWQAEALVAEPAVEAFDARGVSHGGIGREKVAARFGITVWELRTHLDRIREELKPAPDCAWT